MPRKNRQKDFDNVMVDSDEERERAIAEFGNEETNPFLTVRLNTIQVDKLADYICLLPFYAFRPLALFYCMGYSYTKIEKTLKIQKARGVIGYYKDRLTQCMGQTRPIAEQYWRLACKRAMDRYPYPNTSRAAEKLYCKGAIYAVYLPCKRFSGAWRYNPLFSH